MFDYRKKHKLNIEKSEAQFKKNLEKEPLEKGDIPAMIIAALITFLPVMLIVVGIVAFCAWFLVGR